MLQHNNRPCSECPFRRNSLPGWLGPWKIDDLLKQISYGPFPCHKTISETFETSKTCAGAAIFLNNKFQLSRDPDMKAAQKDLKNCMEEIKISVFQTQEEFINHHIRFLN